MVGTTLPCSECSVNRGGQETQVVREEPRRREGNESEKSVNHSGPLESTSTPSLWLYSCRRTGSRLDQDRDSIIAHHLISVDICPTALGTPVLAENGRS